MHEKKRAVVQATDFIRDCCWRIEDSVEGDFWDPRYVEGQVQQMLTRANSLLYKLFDLSPEPSTSVKRY